jgi:peroxiredoxin Q/BCP
MYGVPSTIGFIPGRVTYVIDKQGIVRQIFSSQTQTKRHVEEAKRTLEELEKEQHAA